MNRKWTQAYVSSRCGCLKAEVQNAILATEIPELKPCILYLTVQSSWKWPFQFSTFLANSLTQWNLDSCWVLSFYVVMTLNICLPWLYIYIIIWAPAFFHRKINWGPSQNVVSFSVLSPYFSVGHGGCTQKHHLLKSWCVSSTLPRWLWCSALLSQIHRFMDINFGQIWGAELRWSRIYQDQITLEIWPILSKHREEERCWTCFDFTYWN